MSPPHWDKAILIEVYPSMDISSSTLLYCRRCAWSHGLQPKKLYTSVAVTLALVRVLPNNCSSQVSCRLLAWSKTFYLAYLYSDVKKCSIWNWKQRSRDLEWVVEIHEGGKGSHWTLGSIKRRKKKLIPYFEFILLTKEK